MLDQKDGHIEAVPHETDRPHKLLRLIGIHARGGLIQKQKLRPRRKRPCDLELSLLPVGEISRTAVRDLRELKDGEKLLRSFVHLLLLPEVARRMKDRV